MNSLDISLLSIMLFILTLLGVSIAKVVVLRKYKKIVVIGPLLLLFIPFIFGSGLGIYDKYFSPIMAGLVFSIFIERWIEWILFKIKGVDTSDNVEDENTSILQSMLNKKVIKKEKEVEVKNKENKQRDSLLKEQEERERKRMERRKRREINK